MFKSYILMACLVVCGSMWADQCRDIKDALYDIGVALSKAKKYLHHPRQTAAHAVGLMSNLEYESFLNKLRSRVCEYLGSAATRLSSHAVNDPNISHVISDLSVVGVDPNNNTRELNKDDVELLTTAAKELDGIWHQQCAK